VAIATKGIYPAKPSIYRKGIKDRGNRWLPKTPEQYLEIPRDTKNPVTAMDLRE
jgi:hypothetical protein